MKCMNATRVFVGIWVVFTSVGGLACTTQKAELPGQKLTEKLSDSKPLPALRHITILGTNDIHGAVEPSKNAKKEKLGGLALLSGAVRSIRTAQNRKYGNAGGTLLVDGGDQFQGTLVSNFTEGKLLFQAMDLIGYSAIVPGNHDYDFGPEGWLVDQVVPGHPDQNPKGVIEGLASSVRFPLLSANTYYKASLRASDGSQLEGTKIASAGCEVAGQKVDFSQGKRPSFLKTHTFIETAGIRVAIIGLDLKHTAATTTAANVEDLCFRDEVETYLEVRTALEGQADLFVAVMHTGNSGNDFPLTRFLEAMTKNVGLGQEPWVDAAVAGHTHAMNRVIVNGVPGIQSGSNGTEFGRIDLVYDSQSKKVLRDQTRVFAGVDLNASACDPVATGPNGFCEIVNGSVRFDDVPLIEDPSMIRMIAEVRKQLGPVGDQVVGVAKAAIKRDRINESALSNLLTDGLREATVTDISFMNTGGIRTDIPAGVVTYEKVYEVLPFNNRGLSVGPMPWSTVKLLLEKSIKTCGQYGALMQSGLRIEFSKTCDATTGPVDLNAKLKKVVRLNGEVLLDTASGVEVPATQTFLVSTLDFLAAGGSGYTEFIGTPVLQDFGIVRELLVNHWLKAKASNEWTGTIDGRFVWTGP
ncbi:MAG: 5'-nucleotidase C-terminal domain-containing protein [Bdellovibrionales bacterium]|nr:5'-nucleotidase C-terminal domain-containing protein [Bdellovibrionales bacterium]